MGLHLRAERVYAPFLLLDKEKNEEPSWRKKIRSAFEELMFFLHRQKSMSTELLDEAPVQEFIHATASVLNEAVDEGLRDTKATDELRKKLHESNKIFSGFKTFHEMNEAFPAITDENGAIKPFEQFLKDVQKIDESYNKNYLKSEYNFAVTSSQSASKWERFVTMGDRYDLQYRTANDERVRNSHKSLHNTTLPVTSPFWDEYFPPNGWGCRCTVVQVRKGKYQIAELAPALQGGEKSTSGKHQSMFRFNPGKTGSVFPAYNAYTISDCATCTKNGFKLGRDITHNEQCAACAKIRELTNKQWLKGAEKKRVEQEVKAALKAAGNRIFESTKLRTGIMNLRSEAVKNFLEHAYTEKAKRVLPTFYENREKFIFVKNEILGERKDRSNPRDVRNLERKKARGVIAYNHYKYNYDDTTWYISFEVIQLKDGKVTFEQPYSISPYRQKEK